MVNQAQAALSRRTSVKAEESGLYGPAPDVSERLD